ncbi:14509_t:CDS:2, partial [Entrophospora sp. SA101]
MKLFSYITLCFPFALKNLSRTGVENPSLNQNMINSCRIQNALEKSLIPSFSFSQAFKLAFNKLCKHLTMNQSSKNKEFVDYVNSLPGTQIKEKLRWYWSDFTNQKDFDNAV